MAYYISLPSLLVNLNDMFHVSQLRRYIPDLSHVIQVDDVQVRDNLSVVASHIRIKDQSVNQFHGKEITLVNIAWGRPYCVNRTWDIEIQMRESYMNLFT